jgi:hypothetical protein
MNRATLKQVIKKMVLREMTNNTNKYGTTDGSNDETAVTALGKAVKDGVAAKVTGSSKVTADSPKHQVELSKNIGDCYDVVSVTNGGERKTAQNLKLEDAMSFVKDHAKETEVTYQDKAYNKSLKAAGRDVKKDEKAEEKRVKENDKQEDAMEDAEEIKQIDIADDNTKDAEEKVDADVSPVDADVAPQLGGELVDKISRIIDRVLKSKADAKTAHLKTDSKMESPDKLTVKTKETPKLKEKK